METNNFYHIKKSKKSKSVETTGQNIDREWMDER